MNQKHLELLASDDWRMLLKDYLLPFAFGDRSHGDLGDDVLEIGPAPDSRPTSFAVISSS